MSGPSGVIPAKGDLLPNSSFPHKRESISLYTMKQEP